MEKFAIAPSLLTKAVRVSGAASAQDAVRIALVQMVERDELREMERYSRLSAVRRLNKAMKGPITIVRDAKHLRRLTGV